MPFTTNQTIEVVNRETNYSITCTVMKAATKNPQYHIGGKWCDFIKTMEVKEKNKLSCILDHPSKVLTVWKE
jgi:hypothetical protein